MASDFHNFSESHDSNSDSDSRKNGIITSRDVMVIKSIDVIVLGLVSTPDMDFYHGYDSDSNSSKIWNHYTTIGN